jgi:hypothetical protein
MASSVTRSSKLQVKGIGAPTESRSDCTSEERQRVWPMLRTRLFEEGSILVTAHSISAYVGNVAVG